MLSADQVASFVCVHVLMVCRIFSSGVCKIFCNCWHKTVAFNYFLISLSSLVMSFYVDGVVSLKICFLLFTLFSVFLAETHGTCAYPEIQDEYDYFSTALYLYSKYNVTVSHLSSQQHHARCTRYVRL